MWAAAGGLLDGDSGTAADLAVSAALLAAGAAVLAGAYRAGGVGRRLTVRVGRPVAP
jgi:hypothetical protein